MRWARFNSQAVSRLPLRALSAALGLAFCAGLAGTHALAQAPAAGAKITPKISDGVIKIGLLNDMNSLYADITGQGTVEAVKLAIRDGEDKLAKLAKGEALGLAWSPVRNVSRIDPQGLPLRLLTDAGVVAAAAVVHQARAPGADRQPHAPGAVTAARHRAR